MGYNCGLQLDCFDHLQSVQINLAYSGVWAPWEFTSANYQHKISFLLAKKTSGINVTGILPEHALFGHILDRFFLPFVHFFGL
jgi:hypothetical protein